MKRDEDRPNALKWIRYQELTQFRLFRLLRRRRAAGGGQPSPPRTDPPAQQDPPRPDGG